MSAFWSFILIQEVCGLSHAIEKPISRQSVLYSVIEIILSVQEMPQMVFIIIIYTRQKAQLCIQCYIHKTMMFNCCIEIEEDQMYSVPDKLWNSLIIINLGPSVDIFLEKFGFLSFSNRRV